MLPQVALRRTLPASCWWPRAIVFAPTSPTGLLIPPNSLPKGALGDVVSATKPRSRPYRKVYYDLVPKPLHVECNGPLDTVGHVLIRSAADCLGKPRCWLAVRLCVAQRCIANARQLVGQRAGGTICCVPGHNPSISIIKS